MGWWTGTILQEENTPLGLGLVANVAIALPGPDLEGKYMSGWQTNCQLCIVQG